MSSPVISVIVAAYNAERTLRDCVASIRAQTLADLEIIVADDCSTDGTAALTEVLAREDGRVRLVCCARNGGPAAARNAALDHATGEWVAVVDADDTILPDRLTAMTEAGAMASADIVFDDMFYVTPGASGGDVRYLGDRASGGALSIDTYIRSHRRSDPMPNMGFLKPVIRRRALGSLRYDPSLKIGEDTMLILRLMKQGATACLVPRALYRYHRHDGSISARQGADSIVAINAAYREFLRDDPATLPIETRRLVEALIADNDGRIQAKHLAERLDARRIPSIGTALLRNPGLAKPLARELVSRWKQSRRRR